MADWTAFATAFLNKTSEEIQKGIDKATDYEDKQRELFEQNKGLMQKRKAISDQVKNTATKLKSMGVPEEMVRSAIAEGARGIIDLDRAVQTAVGKYGVSAIKDNPDVILGTSSLDAESSLMVGEGSMGLDDYINQTYGISKGETGSYEAEDVGFMRRMLGVGGKDKVRERLDREAGAMGMSIYDLNQAAKGSDYESIVGGGYVQYATPKVFTADQMSDEVNTLSTMVRGALRGNTEYQTAVTQIASKEESLQRSLQANPTATEEHARLTAELNQARATKAGLEVAVLKPYLRQQASFYDLDSYQKVMGNAVDNIIGVPGFSDSVFNQAESDPVVEQRRPTKDETPSEDPVKVKEAASKPTPIPGTINIDEEETTKEVSTLQDPRVLGGAKTTILEREDGTKVMRIEEPVTTGSGAVVPAGTILDAETTDKLMPAVPSAATPEALTQNYDVESMSAERDRLGVLPITEEEFDALSRADKEALGLPKSLMGKEVKLRFANENYATSAQFKKNADTDAMYKVYVPQFAGKSRTYLVKGSDLELLPDSLLASDGKDAIVIQGVAEGDEDIRKLTTSRLERKFGKRSEKEEDSTSSAPLVSLRPKARPEDPDKEVDPIEVDEATNALLESSAVDILYYLKESGFDDKDDDASIITAIADWANENDKELPEDMDFVVYAIRYGLSL